ncbi:DUF397 domain-containing protein [Streptomyces bobili]|uniref:DUF397 domain-containing protein n=1 Tax=Streptomyces bobili TaxID=67280 RepID=UPI003658F1A2
MPSPWQKSSFSGIDAEDCLEVTRAEPRLLLRESDDPTAVLWASPEGLSALIRRIKAEAWAESPALRLSRSACRATVRRPTPGTAPPL